MEKKGSIVKATPLRGALRSGNPKARLAGILFSCLLILIVANDAVCGSRTQLRPRLKRVPSPRTELNLDEIPFKLVHETYRKTPFPSSEGRRGGNENWELRLINADGSNPVNLTNTPYIDEMYPHVSPDGTKICFVADEGTGRRKVRSVYYMNIDGTERVKVARNARQPCWSPDGKKIAYVMGEYERYSTREYATSGFFIYDLQTGRYKQHPNTKLHHIYALCWSPDGRWFLGVVQGAMEYSDAILAFDADGMRVFDLKPWGVIGCRPDFSPDGKRMVWGETDWELCVGDIDLTAGVPRVANIRKVVGCVRAAKIYHTDFSPDGKYIAFSYGPSKGGQQVGGKARGWNICVADMSGKWTKITTDGNHNKEPDWVPIKTARPVRDLPLEISRLQEPRRIKNGLLTGDPKEKVSNGAGR